MKASKDTSANISNRCNMHLLNVSQQHINMHFHLYIRAQYLNRFIIHLNTRIRSIFTKRILSYIYDNLWTEVHIKKEHSKSVTHFEAVVSLPDTRQVSRPRNPDSGWLLFPRYWVRWIPLPFANDPVVSQRTRSLQICMFQSCIPVVHWLTAM